MRWWCLLVLAACHSTPAPRTPNDSCNSARVSSVRVSGASAALVAPLAVLEGTLDDPPRTERITALTTAMLRAQGYARARIDVTRRESCGVHLEVAVVPGPRFRVARIELATTDEFPDAIRRVLLATNFGDFNAIGGVYREDYLRTALQRLVAAYWDRGWVNAEVGEPSARFDAARAEVVVRVPMKAGTRFRIGNVSAKHGGLEGTAAIAALGLRSGEWYETPKLRAALDRARRRVGRKVEVRPVFFPIRGEIDLEVEVTP